MRDSGSTEWSFSFCTARGVRFGQYREEVLHFVLLESRDMGSTKKKNDFSTAQLLGMRSVSYIYRAAVFYGESRLAIIY